MQFPKYLNYFFEIFVLFGIIYFGFKFIERLYWHLFKLFSNSGTDNLIFRLLPLMTKFLKVILLLLVLGGVLKYHGIEMTSILAGVGIGGLAVGFAAKETIANFFGSVSLILDRVFKVGDYIYINQTVNSQDVEGTVEDINFRSTKIRTVDDALIVIPNNITANCVVMNGTSRKKRLIRETFSLVYGVSKQDIERAKKLVENILMNNRKIFDDYYVNLSALNSYSVDLTFVAYTFETEIVQFLKIKNEILLEIYDKFNSENISFAFPTQTLDVKVEKFQ